MDDEMKDKWKWWKMFCLVVCSSCWGGQAIFDRFIIGWSGAQPSTSLQAADWGSIGRFLSNDLDGCCRGQASSPDLLERVLGATKTAEYCKSWVAVVSGGFWWSAIQATSSRAMAERQFCHFGTGEITGTCLGCLNRPRFPVLIKVGVCWGSSFWNAVWIQKLDRKRHSSEVLNFQVSALASLEQKLPSQREQSRALSPRAFNCLWRS